jgi:transposase
MVRLNAQGWNAPAIAEIFECCEHTVRATLRRWERLGLGGLWDAPGRGDKPRWQEADLHYLEQCLEQDPRTYNSQQLSAKLNQERQVQLSADRIRRLLQKRAFAGNAPAIATSRNKTSMLNGSSKLTLIP